MHQHRLTLHALSSLDQATFTATLSGIYEHSPWIPDRAFASRPFTHRDALLKAMARVVDAATEAEQMGLIRAHPELAGKAAVRGVLTDDSRREQAGAGLDQCSPEEFATIQQFNAAYSAKFGFPFIVAVKGLTRSDIIAAMRDRLGRTREEEVREALAQIHRIAALRVDDKLID